MTRRIIRIVVNIALAALVLAIGVGVSKFFQENAVEAPKEEAETKATLVAVEPVNESAHEVFVTGYGTVIPSRQSQVRAQVGGRVTEVHPELVPGGRIPAEARLVKIDTDDYRLAVAELRTAVEQAEAQLDLERGRVKVAEREWKMFKDSASGVLGEDSEKYASLATRGPQVRVAKAQVQAAKRRLSRARLDLSRTEVEAPFNAFVQGENIELGDLINSQTTLATLVGTDTFWVRVAVPLDMLPRVAVPGYNAEQGASATITLETSGPGTAREGRVVRLLGDLDPNGRMARLLVAVDKPLDPPPGELPLLLGSYVRVDLEAMDDVSGIEVPRYALHEGDVVHVFVDNELQVRRVNTIWKTSESVIVDSGLSAGESVVVTPIPVPVEGMPLRTRSAERQDDAATAEAPSGEAAPVDPPPEPEGSPTGDATEPAPDDDDQALAESVEDAR